MKLIIAGSRHLLGDNRVFDIIDDVHRKINVTLVVSGCAEGADKIGERWAQANGIPVKKFPADWRKHGRAAGPMRNKQMAEFADACLLFPGGKGTTSMKTLANRNRLEIFDFMNHAYEMDNRGHMVLVPGEVTEDRIAVAPEHGEAFMEVWNDRRPLPDTWDAADDDDDEVIEDD